MWIFFDRSKVRTTSIHPKNDKKLKLLGTFVHEMNNKITRSNPSHQRVASVHSRQSLNRRIVLRWFQKHCRNHSQWVDFQSKNLSFSAVLTHFARFFGGAMPGRYLDHNYDRAATKIHISCLRRSPQARLWKKSSSTS